MLSARFMRAGKINPTELTLKLRFLFLGTDPCLKRNVCPYEATCYRTGETSYGCRCGLGYTGVSRPGQPVHKCLSKFSRLCIS